MQPENDHNHVSDSFDRMEDALRRHETKTEATANRIEGKIDALSLRIDQALRLQDDKIGGLSGKIIEVETKLKTWGGITNWGLGILATMIAGMGMLLFSRQGAIKDEIKTQQGMPPIIIQIPPSPTPAPKP